MQKIGVLGSGAVGEVLANGLLAHGYEVMRGSRDPAKLGGWLEEAGAKASTGTFEETARFGDAVLLAVKGSAATSVLELCGVSNLDGKIVIDTTNPIADSPPVNGVLKFFTTLDESLMERLQARAPKARLVKAFSCVGNARMIDPEYQGTRPTMFICGNDDAAKADVSKLLDEVGWDVEDMGKAQAARAIEPLCMLWCVLGFTQGTWTHAFKLLRN